MAEKKTSIQVIERAGQLMDAISGASEGAVPLKMLSAETGLHPSTAFRILASLVDIGFVRRDEAGRYALGGKLRQLGCRVKGGVSVQTEARSVMEWLRNQVGETVNLTLREGDEVVYVERATANRLMRVEQVIGSRAPLHVTAVGKMMLGEGGDRDVEDYSRRTRLPALTRNTITRLDALKDDIQQSLERGYALDREEAEIGVCCVGTLVRDASGEAVAGLSISAPRERLEDAFTPLLLDAARRLSRQLGHRS